MSEELKSAQARIAGLEGEIAKRDARIMGLESQYQRDVWGLNNEGDPIGGEPAGGYANDNARLRAELAALKAQGTVGEVVGWYRLDRPYEMTPYPSVCATWHRLGAPVAPLYAAHAQQVIVPDGWKLVPVEPTPEMVCAAEEAHMPFGDMDIALRMAILSAPSAPATVQGVNQQLLEALEELMYAHTDKAEALATAAIAAARKGEGK